MYVCVRPFGVGECPCEEKYLCLIIQVVNISMGT